MHRTKAWIVVRAAARMKVLGRLHSLRNDDDGGGGGDNTADDLEQALLHRAAADDGDSSNTHHYHHHHNNSSSGHGYGGHGGSALNGSGGRMTPPPPPPCGQSPPPSVTFLSLPPLQPPPPPSPPLSPLAPSHRAGHSALRGRRSRASLVDAPLLSQPLTPVPGATAWPLRDAATLRDMLCASPLNALLVCVPLGYAARALGWGAVAVFTLNFLALVPLALLLGDVTEDLALRFGDVVGGLLNATFGNVVEVVLALAALRKRLYTVVATSLLGSILSNLLLVLGCCFLLGGLRFKTQHFNPTANQATSSLLFLSCVALLVPTAAATLGRLAPGAILGMSRGTAVVLLFIYACYLVFQLYSHADQFAADADADAPALTLPAALLVLALITAAVTGASELLTGAIEAFSQATGLSEQFVGLIILPIAGNACEHVVAVIVALRNKMDLAVGVAVGSSVQIALFAIPLTVVAGWAMGRAMTLEFPHVATIALALAVLHANFVTALSSSHWLMGAQLVATYVVLALAFLYM